MVMDTTQKSNISGFFNGYEIHFKIDSSIQETDDFDQRYTEEFFNSERYIRYVSSTSSDGTLVNLSFKIKNGTRCMSRICLFFDKSNGILFTFDKYIYLPQFDPNCPKADEKSILLQFFKMINYLVKYYDVSDAKIILPKQTKILELYNIINCLTIKFTQNTHMFYDFSTKKSVNMSRKSYRNLVNFSTKNYTFNLIYGEKSFCIDEYFSLHKCVAGRQTRSIASWSIQEEWVKQKTAFISECRVEGELIGYAFFSLFHKTGQYFSGVYVRGNGYKGISHGCLYNGLKFAAELDLNKVFIGVAATECDSEKLKSITKFKMGFSNRLELRLLINMD